MARSDGADEAPEETVAAKIRTTWTVPCTPNVGPMLVAPEEEPTHGPGCCGSSRTCWKRRRPMRRGQQQDPDAFCQDTTCRKIARVVLPGDGGQWCFGHVDAARTDYLARVAERLRDLEAKRPPDPTCRGCGKPARIYPCGWKCDEHAPGTRAVARA